MWLPLYQGVLADVESLGPNADRALPEIEEALVVAGEMGEYWARAFSPPSSRRDFP